MDSSCSYRQGSAAGGQPRREVVEALKVEQGFRQGLALLKRQGLDAGGGGFAQGAAAAGEESEGDFGGFLLAAFLSALLAAFLPASCWRPSASHSWAARVCLSSS